MRDSVLRVDDIEDKDASTVQRELQRSTIHEVVNRAISDMREDHVFGACTEEDDKVATLVHSICYRVVSIPVSVQTMRASMPTVAGAL